MSRAIDGMKIVIGYMTKTKRFEQYLRNVKLLSMSNGECKTELVVSRGELNSEGHLNGGIITTLVDVLSSWALYSYGNELTGVSTNIHVSFLKQAFPGDVLSIIAKVSRIEAPLAFIDVELAKKNSGDVVARGQHTLFLKRIVYN